MRPVGSWINQCPCEDPLVSVMELRESAGSSVSPVTRIKTTERHPFAVTPDRRHPVCAHAFLHIHTI